MRWELNEPQGQGHSGLPRHRGISLRARPAAGKSAAGRFLKDAPRDTCALKCWKRPQNRTQQHPDSVTKAPLPRLTDGKMMRHLTKPCKQILGGRTAGSLRPAHQHGHTDTQHTQNLSLCACARYPLQHSGFSRLWRPGFACHRAELCKASCLANSEHTHIRMTTHRISGFVTLHKGSEAVL